MLVLSEDQRMLMESARGAIAAKAPIAMWRRLRAEASPDGFSRAFWRECAELGWTGVLVPEENGGIDFGVTGAGLIAREMARTLAPSPFLSTAVLAASALRRSESAEAKAKWLPRIAGGDAIVAFALAIETSNSASAAPASKASKAFSVADQAFSMSMCIRAARCCSAWKLPILRSNCLRSFR